MNKIRVAIAGAAVAGSMLAGGVIGAVLSGASVIGASAATPSPTATTAPSTTTPKSNEDATHEAGESAAREAAENNGTAFAGHGPGGGSNEAAAGEGGHLLRGKVTAAVRGHVPAYCDCAGSFWIRSSTFWVMSSAGSAAMRPLACGSELKIAA